MDLRQRAASRVGRLYVRACGGRRSVSLNHALFYLAARGLGLSNYESSTTSGEEAFVRGLALAAEPPRVLFDVGAHSGAWARMVQEQLPATEVYLFEPSPGRAAALLREHPDSHVVAAAVGAEAGRATLFDYDARESSEHASLLAGAIEASGAAAVGVEVDVITLDDFCRDRQVERVDFLKIDTEGFEFEVLRGAADTLASRGVRWIQFEFNTMNVLTRRFLADFEELLTPRFQLHRLLPSGQLLPLDAEPLWLREQFVFQNVIAVRAPAR